MKSLYLVGMFLCLFRLWAEETPIGAPPEISDMVEAGAEEGGIGMSPTPDVGKIKEEIDKDATEYAANLKKEVDADAAEYAAKLKKEADAQAGLYLDEEKKQADQAAEEYLDEKKKLADGELEKYLATLEQEADSFKKRTADKIKDKAKESLKKVKRGLKGKTDGGEEDDDEETPADEGGDAKDFSNKSLTDKALDKLNGLAKSDKVRKIKGQAGKAVDDAIGKAGDFLTETITKHAKNLMNSDSLKQLKSLLGQ